MLMKKWMNTKKNKSRSFTYFEEPACKGGLFYV